VEELPTTAWAVLGLLSFGRELSGYELRKWADASIRFFYGSPAMSQIYRELRRLEAVGILLGSFAIAAVVVANRPLVEQVLGQLGWFAVPLAIVVFAIVASAPFSVTDALAIMNGVLFGPVMGSIVNAIGLVLAAMDVLSDGRLTVGVGLAWSEDECDAANVPYRERGRIGEEAIECMLAIWGPDPVEYHGRHFNLEPAFIGPRNETLGTVPAKPPSPTCTNLPLQPAPTGIQTSNPMSLSLLGRSLTELFDPGSDSKRLH